MGGLRTLLRQLLSPALAPAGALLVAVLSCGGCAGSADKAFYWPGSDNYLTDELTDLVASGACQRVSLQADGGPLLDGVWLPQEDGGLGTVVFCHGNSRNWTYHLRQARWIWDAGYQLLVLDYRGYGRSGGEPSRAGTVVDALAAVDFALERDPARTLIYGHSLGGAIAICAAAERPMVRAVVAESTFSNYRDVAQEVAPALAPLATWMVSSGLDPEDSLPALAPRPLLLMHGKQDQLIPFAMAQRTLEKAVAAGVPSWLIATNTGHRSAWFSMPEEFEREVLTFWREALRGGLRVR